MKLKCDEPLSSFAFNVNSRRYIKAGETVPGVDTPVVSATKPVIKVGRCRLTVSKPELKALRLVSQYALETEM